MFILASNSPRRKELLERENIKFEVITSKIEEVYDKSLPPKDVALYLSKIKALAVSKKYPNRYIIGADTIVVYNKKLYGKPKNYEEAFQTLKMLSNKKHEVITGVTILGPKFIKQFAVKSIVQFKFLSNEIIASYIQTKNPYDKAGAYAIQDKDFTLVDYYLGDFDNIIGLPVKKLIQTIKKYIGDEIYV